MAFASANGGDCIAGYVGIAHFKAIRSDRGITQMDLQAVYCLQAPCNLMSAGKLRADRAVLDGCTDRLIMKHSGIEAAQLTWVNNVLAFKSARSTVIGSPLQDLVLASINYYTMHRRLMYTSKEVVYRACEKARIKITDGNESFCESCHLGKTTEQYPPSSNCTSRPTFNFCPSGLNRTCYRSRLQ